MLQAYDDDDDDDDSSSSYAYGDKYGLWYRCFLGEGVLVETIRIARRTLRKASFREKRENFDPTSSKLMLYVVDNCTGKQAMLYVGQYLSFPPHNIEIADDVIGEVHVHMNEYPDYVCSTCGITQGLMTERRCKCAPAL